jgi:hypothetical protein
VKPLTRYDHEIERNGEVAIGLHCYSSRMVPDDGGDWYAKDEADAVIRELTRQRDNAQQFLDECSVSVAELSEQVAELESERDAALQAVDDLRAERVEVAELQAAVDTWRRDCEAARADAERNRVNAERYEWARLQNNRERAAEILTRRMNADAEIDAARRTE